MQKALKNILTSKSGYSIPALLNIISILLSLRALFKSKSIFWGLVNLLNAGISGYMLFKNTKKILKEK